jgi:hypothetical protein
MSCQQTVEITAVAVRPLHHRSNAEAPIEGFFRFLLFASHFGALVCSRRRTVSVSFCLILPYIETNVLCPVWVTIEGFQLERYFRSEY